jgi:amidase
MARSLEAIKLYCAAVLSAEASPWNFDPKCIPIPWREEVIQPKGCKLRFGIILDNDGEISVHPPINRGLETTKKALEAAGHEVFGWAPIDHPAIVKAMNSSFHTTGAAAILDLTLGNEEPVFGSMKDYEETYRNGEHGTLGPTKLREMILQRNAFQKSYLDRWSATAKDGKAVMDGIICPASCWTAPRLGITQKLFCVNFTGVFNVLGEPEMFPPTEMFLTSYTDYPVCTFPVAFADKNLDKARTAWKSLNELDAKIQADYDPEFYHGTPITLQCVGRRLEDEKVVEMTGIIADALKAYL